MKSAASETLYRDRPVAILPWLMLERPLTCAGVRILGRADLDPVLPADERRRVLTLLDCFAEPYGPDRVLRPIGRAVALVDDSPPQSDAERTTHVERLIHVCSIVGAVVVARTSDQPISADGVRPYLFRHVPDGPFLLPLYGGAFNLTGTDHTRIVRPPWVLQQRIELSPTAMGLIEQIGRLVEPALTADERARQVLTSLRWFVEAHEYGLALRAETNDAALGTAFELLIGLPNQQGKTEKLRQRVRSLLGSDTLADEMEDLYKERSEIVHGGESVNPLLPGGHMTRLHFGLDLYWLCLRAVLAREFDYDFVQQAQEIQRIEQCLVPNSDRLAYLATLNPKSVPRTPRNQGRFIDTLRALHANPRDMSSSSQWRAALRNALSAVCSSLLLRAGQQSDDAVAADMKGLAAEVATLADHLDDSITLRLQGLVSTTPSGAPISVLRPAGLVPLIASRSFLELVTADDLVGGFTYRAVERWHGEG